MLTFAFLAEEPAEHEVPAFAVDFGCSEISGPQRLNYLVYNHGVPTRFLEVLHITVCGRGPSQQLRDKAAFLPAAAAALRPRSAGHCSKLLQDDICSLSLNGFPRGPRRVIDCLLLQ